MPSTNVGPRMRKAIAIFSSALITLVFVALFALIPSPATPPPPSADLAAIFRSQLLSFASDDATSTQQALRSAQANYDVIRTQAVAHARRKAARRSGFELAGHVASVFALGATFAISFLGAAKGIALSQNPTSEEISNLGRRQSRLRKGVLALGTAGALFAGGADRLSAQALKLAADAREAVHIIESCDASMQRALSAADIANAAGKLELDILAL